MRGEHQQVGTRAAPAPPRKPNSPHGELLHLDFARFVAAMGIVLAHSIEFVVPASNRAQVNAKGLAAGLPLFVDLFFVVSGFVIAYVYADRMRSLTDYGTFLQRRLGRLIPLHLVLFVFWLVFWVLISQLNLPMAHHFSLSVGCLATTAFLLISFVDCHGASINGITWSIGAEMAMYVAFPFVSIFLRRRWPIAIATVVMFGFALFRLGGLSHWTQETALRAPPAFLFGVLLFTVRISLARLPAASIGLCLALILLLIGGICSWPTLPLLALAYIAPALAIAADSRPAPAWIRRLAPLGQLTYSIYMLHPVLITIVINGVADKVLHLSPLPMGAIMLMTYIALLIVSWASYQFYESPMRKWVDSLRLFRIHRA